MTERSNHYEIRQSNQVISNSDGFAPDGGVVVVPSASPAPDAEIQSPEVGDGDQDNNIDPRTERALTEEMDVSLLRKGGVYEVKSQSGSYYEVDVASETCTCPDFVKREPDGGCKHLRRVDTEIREDAVPRPDGRLPDNPRLGKSSDPISQATECIAKQIESLESEIDHRSRRHQQLHELQTVLKSLR